jgi:hypothetical protein
LLADWQKAVATEGRFVSCASEGIRPVPCDLTCFLRPHLHRRDGQPLDSKHYVSAAGKALPAIVFGLCARVGHVGPTGVGHAGPVRLALPRLVLRREEGEREADLQRRLVTRAAETLGEDEALIVDAGFPLADLLGCPGLMSPGAGLTSQSDGAMSQVTGVRFVARVRSNVTKRWKERPAQRPAHLQRPGTPPDARPAGAPASGEAGRATDQGHAARRHLALAGRALPAVGRGLERFGTA